MAYITHSSPFHHFVRIGLISLFCQPMQKVTMQHRHGRSVTYFKHLQRVMGERYMFTQGPNAAVKSTSERALCVNE